MTDKGKVGRRMVGAGRAVKGAGEVEDDEGGGSMRGWGE